MIADKPQTSVDLRKEIERLKEFLQEKEDRLQEAQDTLEAIRTGAVDGIVRSTPEGEQVFVLKGSDQPYRDLIEEMSEGALLISKNGIILYCNSGFARLVGSPIEKVMGTPVSDWVSARNIELVNDLVSGDCSDGREVFEVAFCNVSHEFFPTQISATKIRIGAIDASALIVTDLSKHMGKDIKRYTGELEKEVIERKRAEIALMQRTEELEVTQRKLEELAAHTEEYANNMEELAQERLQQLKDSERLAAIGATAGMVGHDIRNPLQAITGDVYLLRDYLSGMPDRISVKKDVAESLESIEQNVSYINKIVADLQDYSRKVTPKLVDANLYDLVVRCFRSIIIPESVSPTIEIEQSLTLKTDTDLFQRILTNLVINALQAMPKGGELKIKASENNSKVRLVVEDTGTGIPEQVKAKMFTPMMTTKAKGQGLGLAVVKRLVEALNGSISYESEEGKGTTFIIEFSSWNQRS